MSDVQERAAVIRGGAFKLGLALGLAGVLLGVWLSWPHRDDSGSQWLVQALSFSGFLGLYGFAIGGVLGLLLGLVPDVRIDAWFIVRHAIAFVGSLLAWTLLTSLLGTFFEAKDTSPEAVDDGPFCGFCCGLQTWILFIMFPFSAIAESLLIRRLGWRWWMHVPVMLVVFFVTCVAPATTLLLLFGASFDYETVIQSDIVAVGFAYSLWGCLYWSLLRACDALLSVVVGQSEEQA